MAAVTDSGLRAADALPVMDVPCDHPKWQALNKSLGCIHPEHGTYPFALTDHHSGVRLVDGVPTRHIPSERGR